MELCKKQGCGVCIGCSKIPDKKYGDICRYVAEEILSTIFDEGVYQYKDGKLYELLIGCDLKVLSKDIILGDEDE